MTRSTDLAAKRDRLEAALRARGRVAVAVSGGVDSSVLLAEAARVLGPEAVLAVTAETDLCPPGDAEAARAAASACGVEHAVVRADPLGVPAVQDNAPDRCYHCKRLLLAALAEAAAARGFPALVEGSNADDAGAYRPGMRAVQERGITSPLLEAGLAKADVRALAKALGLAACDRPASPCLATRFPYGRHLTREALARVAVAEAVLHDLGFAEVRVRDHEEMARIEVPPTDLPRLLDVRGQVATRLRALGYKRVTCDLEGYRSGAMDVGLGG